MKIKLLFLFPLFFLLACGSEDVASGSHQTENVISDIELHDGQLVTNLSARVLQGDVSPFDSSSYSRVEVNIDGSKISFQKPSSSYWIEVISEDDPKQVYWATVGPDSSLPEVIRLQPSAHMTAYYPASGLDVIEIGIGGTDLRVEIDEFGVFRIENMPPGIHECYGLARVEDEDGSPIDSLVYLGSFSLDPGENIINESQLF